MKEIDNLPKVVKKPKKKRHNPEDKAEGRIYYLYSKLVMETEKKPMNLPRVTVAAHVSEEKKEIYYGVKITDSRDNFIKREGRIKAMGIAVSKRRNILHTRSTSPKFVRDKLNSILNAEFFAAIKRQGHSRDIDNVEIYLETHKYKQIPSRAKKAINKAVNQVKELVEKLTPAEEK